MIKAFPRSIYPYTFKKNLRKRKFFDLVESNPFLVSRNQGGKREKKRRRKEKEGIFERFSSHGR